MSEGSEGWEVGMLGDQHGWPCRSTSAPGGLRPKHIQQTMTRLSAEGREGTAIQNGRPPTSWPGGPDFCGFG